MLLFCNMLSKIFGQNSRQYNSVTLLLFHIIHIPCLMNFSCVVQYQQQVSLDHHGTHVNILFQLQSVCVIYQCDLGISTVVWILHCIASLWIGCQAAMTHSFKGHTVCAWNAEQTFSLGEFINHYSQEAPMLNFLRKFIHTCTHVRHSHTHILDSW